MPLFRRFAWFTLAFCVGVILWGAYVRATGSGAGCGAHWPLCNGQAVVTNAHTKTLIEYTHRLSSGLSLLLVFVLFAWAWKLFPRGSFGLRAASAAFVAICLEALVGAALVLLRLVELDQSLNRVIVISLHLVNTLFLVAALTLLALAPTEAQARWRWPVAERRWWPRSLLLGFALLGAMGAVAALGDTLFPSTSLAAGLQADFDSKRHFLERIRIFHPVFAVLWVGALAWWTAGVGARLPSLVARGRATIGLACLNLGLGAVNLLLLAPIPLQILHLFVANLLWILFVSLVFSAASRWQ